MNLSTKRLSFFFLSFSLFFFFLFFSEGKSDLLVFVFCVFLFLDEFTPEDFSVSHPSLNSSIPMKYLGTRPNSSTASECVEGFDNIGFVLGTSSNIFASRDSSNSSTSVWSKVTNALGTESVDEGLVPNPFQGLGNQAFPDQDSEDLMLADGGFAGEKLPLFPFLHRKVDVIFASDAVSDVPNVDRERCFVFVSFFFWWALISSCLIKSDKDEQNFFTLHTDMRTSYRVVTKVRIRYKVVEDVSGSLFCISHL